MTFSDTKRREIEVLVNEVCVLEHSLKLPVMEGFEDFDRLEAIDILKRIERRMLANMPPRQESKLAVDCGDEV